jgi:signal transduction histidine kinase
MGTTRGRSKAVRRIATVIGVITPVVFVVFTVVDAAARSWWTDRTFGRWMLAVDVAAVAGNAWGGVALLHRRARPTLGVIAVALAVVHAGQLLFWYQPYQGWAPVWSLALWLAMWPLFYGLVLAFPLDRPDRHGTRLLRAFVVVTVLFFVFDLAVDQRVRNADDPVRLFGFGNWTGLVSGVYWYLLSGMIVPAGVLFVLRRRLQRWPSAPEVTRPAWTAGLIGPGVDLALFALWPLVLAFWYHGDDWTPFGVVYEAVIVGRFSVVVILMVVTSSRSVRAETATRMIDIDPVSPVDVRWRLRATIGDRSARLLFPADRSWIDSEGHLVPVEDWRPERSLTRIVRGDEVIAAIDQDASVEVHPAVLDAVAVAVTLDVDRFRDAALANAEERRLRLVGRAALRAEDQARRALERDLHDGAQQALVALALESAMAARATYGDPSRCAPAVESVASSLDAVARDLVEVAGGRVPALLASEGLSSSLRALAATSGLAADVTIPDGPAIDELPEPVRLMLWLAAAEAVANTLKHSGAHRLRLAVRIDGGEVELEVTDDGRGGVSASPRAITARAESVGGAVEVTSAPDGGTSVVVRAPLDAGVPA